MNYDYLTDDTHVKQLIGYKVVVFGVTNRSNVLLQYLFSHKIDVTYFIDNTENSIPNFNTPVHTPEKLLNENKHEIKIIIAADFFEAREILTDIPRTSFTYESAEEFLLKHGFEKSILHTKAKGCTLMAYKLMFSTKIEICCTGNNLSKAGYPQFPYLSTAEETIVNFLDNRKKLIQGLNTGECNNISKLCLGCRKLSQFNYLFGITHFSSITIACKPSICQASCIYCGVYCKPENNIENSVHSQHPKMTAEMLVWLKNNNYINENCTFLVSPAEITIMPHKDLLLDTIKNNRAYFLTNAIVFNQKIASSMQENGSALYVSIDSATRNTFKVAKGIDAFPQVIQNLKRYRKYGNIQLKYIVITGINDSEKEMTALIELLEALNLDNIILSLDVFGTKYGKMPLRTPLFSLSLFIDKLTKNNIKIKYYNERVKEVVESFINKYVTDKDTTYYANLRDKYTTLFNNLKPFNYAAYGEEVFYTELAELAKYCDKNALTYKDIMRYMTSSDSPQDFYIPSNQEDAGIVHNLNALPADTIFYGAGNNMFNFLRLIKILDAPFTHEIWDANPSASLLQGVKITAPNTADTGEGRTMIITILNEDIANEVRAIYENLGYTVRNFNEVFPLE
ncbi:MAG: radical SAM protein [Defluviitaleaceae bacterium]|nr:radical SAM protein [Defluviitaleaceae bacterium]MCL2274439.1 radical SAM protein [Defluviitaleaceae bacterium]